MSLFDYLNMDLSASSSATTSLQSAQAQRLLAAKAEGKATTTATPLPASVLITTQARRAANAEADAGKEATSLAAELRVDLNTQYTAAGQKNSADLTTMSGRALATVTLNESGNFSKAEIAAAKQELRARDRQSILAIFESGPLTAASLTTYTRDLLASRDLMSSEEQRLRETDPSLR